MTGNSISQSEKQRKCSGLASGYPCISTKDVKNDFTIDYENGVRIPFDAPSFRLAPAGTPLLTEQLPEDGDALDLLAEIQAEKNAKLKLAKSAIPKPSPPSHPRRGVLSNSRQLGLDTFR